MLAVTGPSGSGKSTLLGVLLGLTTPGRGHACASATRTCASSTPARGTHSWRGCRSARTCSRARSPTTSAPAARTPPRRRSGAPSPTPAWPTWSTRLPAGVETRLGERGAGLSAGERRRLALARAFVRDAPLLLLDEPTAGLDGRTEAEIVRTIRRLAHGRTVILVAHRPALLALADRVLELAPAEVAA